MHDLRSRVESEQDGHAAVQRAVAADREDISKQAAALLDMGQKVLYSSSCAPPSEAMHDCRNAALRLFSSPAFVSCLCY